MPNIEPTSEPPCLQTQTHVSPESEQPDAGLRDARTADLQSATGEDPANAPAWRPSTAERPGDRDTLKINKRVLVVDDSMEVRELSRSLLSRRGYDVQIAVDGVDGWHAVRAGNFDLVLTDVDMPLVDGIRLTRLIRNDPRFHSLPVLIACNPISEHDKRRGLEAGADYYVLTGSFHDTLAQTVASLIGPAR